MAAGKWVWLAAGAMVLAGCGNKPEAAAEKSSAPAGGTNEPHQPPINQPKLKNERTTSTIAGQMSGICFACAILTNPKRVTLGDLAAHFLPYHMVHKFPTTAG